jgi:hypothetical protein
MEVARKIWSMSEMEAADSIAPSAEALLGWVADQDSSVRRAVVQARGRITMRGAGD